MNLYASAWVKKEDFFVLKQTGGGLYQLDLDKVMLHEITKEQLLQLSKEIQVITQETEKTDAMR